MAQADALPEPAEDAIMEWITYKYNQSKGLEIGTTNPSLMPSLFAEQCCQECAYVMPHYS
jgi:hypothetical protein